MTLLTFYTIISLVLALSGTIFAIIALTVRKNSEIDNLNAALNAKDEVIKKLHIMLSNLESPEQEPEKKLKRYYFQTEKCIELAKLWDQTNDRTKDAEAMAILWKTLEQVVPQAAYPSASLNKDDPIRFYLEWDENDKDPLKEQDKKS